MPIQNLRLVFIMLCLVVLWIIIGNTCAFLLFPSLASANDEVESGLFAYDVLDRSIYGNDNPDINCLICGKPFRTGEFAIYFVREVDVLGNKVRVFQPCHFRDIYGDLVDDIKEGTK